MQEQGFSINFWMIHTQLPLIKSDFGVVKKYAYGPFIRYNVHYMLSIILKATLVLSKIF